MRLPVIVLMAVLLAPLAGRASGDAHDAVAATAFASLGDGEGMRQALFAGYGGVGLARASGGHGGFVTCAWRSSSIETGLVRRLGGWSRIDAWSSLSLALSLRGAVTAGPRGLVAIGGKWGERLIVRPSISLSVASVFGPQTETAWLMPIEASVELGAQAGRWRPFVRLAAGSDLTAARHLTGRGEIALGLAWPQDAI